MLRIVFMGTPEFSIPSLEALISAGHDIKAVVTPPDRPAGRGRKLKACPVKEYALANGLPVLQPEKLRDPEFVSTIKNIDPDIIVVVAFRMLPEIIWSIPKKGTFNLHSSLLPNYRGAAPMNHAIINGEKESGITTFMLDNKIDTGKILFRKKIDITDDMNVGDLHDKLMMMGADLVLKTVDALEKGKISPISQDDLPEINEIRHAPKFTKEDLRINWTKSAPEIYNFIRGLSPYPTAYTTLESPSGEITNIKVYQTSKHESQSLEPGHINTDGKTYFYVGTAKGTIALESLQIAGKRRMNITDFLRGFEIINNSRLI